MTDATSVTRQSIRTPRAAAVAGIAFSVLLTLGLVLIRLALPSDPEDAEGWLEDGPPRYAVVPALNLLPFAGLAFLWFIGVVRDRIGEGEDRFFATVFFGSGLLFIAMLFAAGAIAGGIVLTAHDRPSAELWSFGRRVSHTLLTVYAMRMAAVFALSTTTIASRLGLAPRWLTVLGLGTGTVLLFSAGFIPWLEVIFPAWVFVFSVHILIASFQRADPTVVHRPGR